MTHRHDGSPERESGVATRERTENPPRYKVVLHNDDYTTMEFVVDVLRQFFHKDATEAMRIMLLVHYTGIGVCGVFSREIAETKVAAVQRHAQENGMPLKCTMERE